MDNDQIKAPNEEPLIIGVNETEVAAPVKEDYSKFKLEKIPYQSGLIYPDKEAIDAESVTHSQPIVGEGEEEVAYPVTEKDAKGQSKEENAKYAAARREAEAEAKMLKDEREADAKLAGFDSYAEMQKFIRDQKEAARKAELQEKGIDVDALKEIIKQEKEADPIYVEYTRIVQDTAMQASIKQLNDEWGTSFNNADDLQDMPNYDKFYAYVVNKGLSFNEAYKLAAFDPKKVIAEHEEKKRATINQTSKSHIRPSGGAQISDFKDILPPEIIKEWDKNRKHFPNKTIEDFAKLYNKLK